MPQPSFNRPPVAETILGVQFDRLSGLTNAHLGLFWRSLGPEWSLASDAPLIPQETESFGSPAVWNLAGLMSLKLSQDASSRLQLRTAAADRMVQVQNGKLLYHWTGSGDNYPRFSQVRTEFEAIVERFERFLDGIGLGVWRPNQWEVSYVNHMPQGTVWNTPADWAGLLRIAPHPAAENDAAVVLESVQGQWHYEIRPRRGRLHVGLVHGKVPGPDDRELLVLTLTARGPIAAPGAVRDGIQLGHDVIVDTFASVTSDAARLHWEQTT